MKVFFTCITSVPEPWHNIHLLTINTDLYLLRTLTGLGLDYFLSYDVARYVTKSFNHFTMVLLMLLNGFISLTDARDVI